MFSFDLLLGTAEQECTSLHSSLSCCRWKMFMKLSAKGGKWRQKANQNSKPSHQKDSIKSSDISSSARKLNKMPPKGKNPFSFPVGTCQCSATHFTKSRSKSPPVEFNHSPPCELDIQLQPDLTSLLLDSWDCIQNFPHKSIVFCYSDTQLKLYWSQDMWCLFQS